MQTYQSNMFLNKQKNSQKYSTYCFMRAEKNAYTVYTLTKKIWLV